MSRKKVCVFIGSRANYSSAKPLMRSIQANPALELQVLAGASALLDRYGNVVELVVQDGFKVDYRVHSLVEGENNITMTKSAGLGMVEAATAFDNLRPDVVVVIGDRFDVIPIAMAAAFMNITLAHTMGGEVTGTIDESIRHAMTKFAHVHFPANEDARERIIKMGEDPATVFNVGCPRNDLVLEEITRHDSYEVLASLFEKHGGVGENFDLRKPFLLVSQHPVTTEFGQNRHAMEQTLEALKELAMNTILLWPNSDAGGEEVSKAIRIFREKNDAPWLHAFKNLPTRVYVHLMNTTACLVGNSSSGVREGALIGTPVVNLGTRQNGRQCGTNVIQVGNDSAAILKAIREQLAHGKYKRDPIYGDGKAGDRIAEVLATKSFVMQKQITY